jgi:hypothetical protein
VNHDEILAVVRETLADEDSVEVTSSQKKGYLTILFQDRESGPSHASRHARLWTLGVEAFFLELDDLYDLKEFDWEPDGQREIVRELTRLALSYLRGAGVEVEMDARSWFGRRRRRYLDVVLDGETHRFTRYRPARVRGRAPD